MSFSLSNATISSLRILLSSEVFKYLSRATRCSILSIILRVVSTPTSDVTRASSKLSRTSSSTLLLPITALDILENTLSLVLAMPDSKVCCSCCCCCTSLSFLKKLKNPISLTCIIRNNMYQNCKINNLIAIYNCRCNKKASQKLRGFNILLWNGYLLSKVVFYLLILNHLFLKNICTGLW